MKRIGSLLIVVALIAGMAGCGDSGYGGDSEDVGQSYGLTINSTAGGAVVVDNVTIPGKAVFTYDAPTVVSLNATPDSGYQFVEWNGDVGTVDNAYASQTLITVDGDYWLTAKYEEQVPPPVEYILTVFSTAGGSVTTPGEGTHIYDEETMVNLVARPASGYEFVKWTGNVDTIANVNAASTTITVNGRCYICANFREVSGCG